MISRYDRGAQTLADLQYEPFTVKSADASWIALAKEAHAHVSREGRADRGRQRDLRRPSPM
jgi:hypothetical protein